MKYLIDTHVWIWFFNEPERLSRATLALLKRSSHAPLGLSTFSLWEVCKLVEKQRIQLTLPVREWMRRAVPPAFIELIPIDPDIAAESSMLPGSFHNDPADQVITATARVRDIELVTADQRLLDYPYVKTVKAV